MTKEEATKKAIERIKGKDCEPGTIVASQADPLTWKLLRYEGNQAIVTITGEERSFPRAEMFDVKQVINIANHYLNVGFWEEGMESTILTIQPTPHP